MTQVLDIPAQMPGLNELIAAKASIGRKVGAKGRRYVAYNDAKRKWTAAIVRLCREQGIQPVDQARLVFRWREPNRRRDLDNIAAGGRKLILDALVKAGVLPGDGWAHVTGFSDEFTLDQSAGVTVEITSVKARGEQCDSLEPCLGV